MIKIKKKYFFDGRFILWIPLLLLRPFLPHFPHLSLRLRFVTANNRYLPGYLGQHMPSSERLGADEHQMKIYRYNFERLLTGLNGNENAWLSSVRSRFLSYKIKISIWVKIKS